MHSYSSISPGSLLGQNISGCTRVLGLIADPIAQARTPAMANALLAQHHQFGQVVLVPMQVSASGLAAFVDGLRAFQNFGGAVVSMPHKTAMAALVDELTPQAQRIHAVNVVRREPDGRLIGTALDGEGFVGGLAASGHAVVGTSCLLVGAGGAASAIAFALAEHGCTSLTLINRTQHKCDALAERIRTDFPNVIVATSIPLNARFDLGVNGTSLGMQASDALPLPDDLIDRCTLIAECVIAPEMTPLLIRARGRGRLIHTGVPMLAAQMALMLSFMGVQNNL